MVVVSGVIRQIHTFVTRLLFNGFIAGSDILCIQCIDPVGRVTKSRAPTAHKS